MVGPFGDLLLHWQQIVIVHFALAVDASSAHLGAIGQRNSLKRLLAYSSINNIGFMRCSALRLEPKSGGGQRHAGLPRSFMSP